MFETASEIHCHRCQLSLRPASWVRQHLLPPTVQEPPLQYFLRTTISPHVRILPAYRRPTLRSSLRHARRALTPQLRQPVLPSPHLKLSILLPPFLLIWCFPPP